MRPPSKSILRNERAPGVLIARWVKSCGRFEGRCCEIPPGGGPRDTAVRRAARSRQELTDVIPAAMLQCLLTLCLAAAAEAINHTAGCWHGLRPLPLRRGPPVGRARRASAIPCKR